MKALFKIAAIALAAGAALGAHAQDYPAAGKTITLIVPFTAGGPTDKVARDLAESMRKQLNNATIVVDNADGAGSTIGTAKAARARPDGYTLLINHIGMSTIPSLYRKLSFNVLNDFEYAGIINDVPMTLIGRPSLPAKNFAEVKDWIGKNQGNITNLKFTNRSVDFFEMLIDIEVRDVRHLTNIIAALRATPIITSVERARG